MAIPKSARADRTIGEHECMTMEVAANWFNDETRGCQTSKEVLELHASANHFPTFLLRNEVVMSITVAEEILEQNPFWLHQDVVGGVPAGYLLFEEACEIYSVSPDFLVIWIKAGKVSVKRLKIHDDTGYVVRQVDVERVAASRRESRDYYREHRHTFSRGVTLARPRKKEQMHKYAKRKGFNGERLKTLVKQGLIKDVDIVGDPEKPKSTRYQIHVNAVDKMVSRIPELKAYLKGETFRLTQSLQAQLEEYDPKAFDKEAAEGSASDPTEPPVREVQGEEVGSRVDEVTAEEVAGQAAPEPQVEEAEAESAEEPASKTLTLPDLLMKVHRARQMVTEYDRLIAEGYTDDEIVASFTQFEEAC